MKLTTNEKKAYLTPNYYSPPSGGIREYSISYGGNASSSSSIEQPPYDYNQLTNNEKTNNSIKNNITNNILPKPEEIAKKILSGSPLLSSKGNIDLNKKNKESPLLTHKSNSNINDLSICTKTTNNEEKSNAKSDKSNKYQELIKNSPLEKFINVEDFMGKELGKFPQISEKDIQFNNPKVHESHSSMLRNHKNTNSYAIIPKTQSFYEKDTNNNIPSFNNNPVSSKNSYREPVKVSNFFENIKKSPTSNKNSDNSKNLMIFNKRPLSNKNSSHNMNYDTNIYNKDNDSYKLITSPTSISKGLNSCDDKNNYNLIPNKTPISKSHSTRETIQESQLYLTNPIERSRNLFNEHKMMTKTPSPKKETKPNFMFNTPTTIENKKNTDKYKLISPENKDKISLDFLMKSNINNTSNYDSQLKLPKKNQIASEKLETDEKAIKNSFDLSKNISNFESALPQGTLISNKSNKTLELKTATTEKNDELGLKAFEIFKKPERYQENMSKTPTKLLHNSSIMTNNSNVNESDIQTKENLIKTPKKSIVNDEENKRIDEKFDNFMKKFEKTRKSSIKTDKISENLLIKTPETSKLNPFIKITTDKRSLSQTKLTNSLPNNVNEASEHIEDMSLQKKPIKNNKNQDKKTSDIHFDKDEAIKNDKISKILDKNENISTKINETEESDRNALTATTEDLENFAKTQNKPIKSNKNTNDRLISENLLEETQNIIQPYYEIKINNIKETLEDVDESLTNSKKIKKSIKVNTIKAESDIDKPTENQKNNTKISKKEKSALLNSNLQSKKTELIKNKSFQEMKTNIIQPNNENLEVSEKKTKKKSMNEISTDSNSKELSKNMTNLEIPEKKMKKKSINEANKNIDLNEESINKLSKEAENLEIPDKKTKKKSMNELVNDSNSNEISKNMTNLEIPEKKMKKKSMNEENKTIELNEDSINKLSKEVESLEIPEKKTKKKSMNELVNDTNSNELSKNMTNLEIPEKKMKKKSMNEANKTIDLKEGSINKLSKEAENLEIPEKKIKKKSMNELSDSKKLSKNLSNLDISEKKTKKKYMNEDNKTIDLNADSNNKLSKEAENLEIPDKKIKKNLLNESNEDTEKKDLNENSEKILSKSPKKDENSESNKSNKKSMNELNEENIIVNSNENENSKKLKKSLIKEENLEIPEKKHKKNKSMNELHENDKIITSTEDSSKNSQKIPPQITKNELEIPNKNSKKKSKNDEIVNDKLSQTEKKSIINEPPQKSKTLKKSINNIPEQEINVTTTNEQSKNHEDDDKVTRKKAKSIKKTEEQNYLQPVTKLTDKKVSFTADAEKEEKINSERNLKKSSIKEKSLKLSQTDLNNNMDKKVSFRAEKTKQNETSENPVKKSSKEYNLDDSSAGSEEKMTKILKGSQTTKNKDLNESPDKDKNFPKSPTRAKSVSRKEDAGKKMAFLNLNEFVSTLGRGEVLPKRNSVKTANDILINLELLQKIAKDQSSLVKKNSNSSSSNPKKSVSLMPMPEIPEKRSSKKNSKQISGIMEGSIKSLEDNDISSDSNESGSESLNEKESLSDESSVHTQTFENIEENVSHVDSIESFEESKSMLDLPDENNLYYMTNMKKFNKTKCKSNYFKELYCEHLIQSFKALNFCKILPPVPEDALAKRKVSLTSKGNHLTKKTLIFDLDETLIHCNENIEMSSDVILEIKLGTGTVIEAGINIRPHAVEVLKELSQYYEIIVFTASHGCYANRVLDYLDPKGELIDHRLFRENCVVSEDGAYIKDLRVFENRDLSDMAIIDNACYSFAYHIENGVPIIPYYNNKNDEELLDLKNYLMKYKEQDIRELNKNTFKLHLYSECEDYKDILIKMFPDEE